MAAQRTILIIDDTESILEFLHKSFEKAGYTVFTAKDGREGLQLALKTVPDVVLSDVVMPEMDGYELCKQLKQHPATQSLPVVLLTARGDSASTVKGFEAGANEYISKPFEIKEVLARINRLLKWVAPQKERAPKISGTLDKTPFFDLLRFCEEHRISGMLHVSRQTEDGERKGEIRLNLGEIEAVTLGDATDITDVLDELLEWPDGTFAVFQEELQLPADEASTSNETRDQAAPAPEPEEVVVPEPRLHDQIHPILQELQRESDDLKHAIILDHHGTLISAVSETGQDGQEELLDVMAKTLAFSERTCRELDLGLFDETLLSSDNKLFILYPIDSFGALGVETLKENQGMVRWNCRDAIVKIQETLGVE